MNWISAGEFLEREELAETKHLYYAGSVTAMAGGTIEHGRIATNLIGEMYSALKGRDCAVFGSDVLLQTGSEAMFTYPDLMVVCGAVERMVGKRNVVRNPVFVVEVLSPSTEGMDRGLKSREYRLTPSIRQYALVSVDQPLVEMHTRGEDGQWRISEVAGLDGECEFPALGCRIAMAAVYEGVVG